MIEKEILFDSASREKLKTGVDVLAEAVATTLGASGRTVIIEDQFGNPHVTKDGVTVANSILLSDPVENLGCSILKQASQKTATEAGDGTTTSCVLAKAIIDGCFEKIDDIQNVTLAKNGIEDAAKAVVSIVEKHKRLADMKNLRQIATISANGDKYIGELIADAYEKVGKDGVVTMDESTTGEDYTEITKGTRIMRGYGSPFSVNNLRKKSVEYSNPLIVISDQKIDMHERLHFAFEACIRQKRPLLLIAELDDKVKLFITQNINQKNLTCNFITPEGFGIKKFELLQDLALMTGAKVISELSGDSVNRIDASYLGTCQSMTSTEYETILVFEEVEDPKKEETIEWIQNAIKDSSNKHDRWHLEDRLSKLAGGVATIRVSGNSEVEMKEKKDRVDDSIHATRAALQEGIVAGGGIALFNAYQKIRPATPKAEEDSYIIGWEIMVEALPKVLERIISNGGNDSLEIILSLPKTRNHGYDVKRRRIGNMFSMGIVDPFKVTKNAVLNSASVASTILTTSCVISNKRIKK
jgi:chaperonin GroEL